MAENNGKRTVAIACQGGGSHTAFTAGVLKKLLKEKDENNQDYEITGLSGTSGGAICALLAWYGLLTNDTDKAVRLLDSFWRDNSANSFQDKFLNDWLLQMNRLFANIGGAPTISPYSYPSWGQDLLRNMLEKHVDFGSLKELAKPSSPLLLVGAVDICSGQFKAFKSRKGEITVDAILASAALPTLFRAVHTGGGVYWDGLFSQNPPIRDLCGEKPDEIWVIQINPETSESEPKRVSNMMDRRDELAGNLSLNQEIFFIEKVNDWVREGVFSGTGHKIVEVRRIPMLRRGLQSEAKMNRDPEFIQGLMAYGEEQAGKFLKEHGIQARLNSSATRFTPSGPTRSSGAVRA